MALAETFVFCVAAYFGIGAMIAIVFLVFGVARIDAAAKGASIFFRSIIFLGCAALWPAIILRVLSMKKINQPLEGEQ